MPFEAVDELERHGFSALVGLLLGAVVAWFFARWKRLQERRRLRRGDARDTVVIHHHLVEAGETPDGGRRARVLRVRSLGQEDLHRVIPNGHLAAVLFARAWQVTPRNTLISMEGAEGSYLLETLTNFICDRVANAPFDHDLYVMAPCCEPRQLAAHQPITVLLIAVADLALFESWPACREVEVEHGSDGARVLTLMELARRWKAEQETLARMRQAGQRTLYVETMYLLDLALDRRAARVATKQVPWGRFEDVLKQLNLE